MERGEIVQIVRRTLAGAKGMTDQLAVADRVVKALEDAEVLKMTKGGLTPDQLKRAAYGAAHEIIRQCLDNGELQTLELAEFLPNGYDMEESDWDDLQAALENNIMSDLYEEQAKLDS